jgi:hypothetical protein
VSRCQGELHPRQGGWLPLAHRLTCPLSAGDPPATAVLRRRGRPYAYEAKVEPEVPAPADTPTSPVEDDIVSVSATKVSQASVL